MSDIGAVLEFQVIGCDAIGQRNPGKYRNPGEEIGRKSGLGKSAKYRSATFTVSRRKSGGGIIHGILALSSITLGEPRR